MSKQVEIEALRPFNKTPQGNPCDIGETFPVGESRAEELIRLGLARRVGGKAERVERAAPATEKKVLPGRSTKAFKIGGSQPSKIGG